jgi:hypothetical protein
VSFILKWTSSKVMLLLEKYYLEEQQQWKLPFSEQLCWAAFLF